MTECLNVKHHFVKDMIQDGEFKLLYVNGENQLTDLMTKILPFSKFDYLSKSNITVIWFVELRAGVGRLTTNSSWYVYIVQDAYKSLVESLVYHSKTLDLWLT